MRSFRSKTRVKLAQQLRGRILDSGSGDDVFGQYLRRDGSNVIGLNVDEAGLKRTPGIRVVASCAAIPFVDDYFDAVCCCAVVGHVREHALPEMVRVTGPGGRTVAVRPNRYSPPDCLKRLLGMDMWAEIDGHIRMYAMKELQFYGPVHGQAWFVPFMGLLFWRRPRLAHVWIANIHVTEKLKAKIARRFPDCPVGDSRRLARICL